MARPIKHACANCGYPRWRHVGDARQPKTCEKFKKASSKEAAPVTVEEMGRIIDDVRSMCPQTVDAPIKTGDERVETPTCPEPMTGGE